VSESLPPAESLNVLMIALGDEVLTGLGGDTRERHIEYASYVGHLHMVVYSPRRQGLAQTAINEKLTIYPTRSPARMCFVWDAYRLGARICRQARIDVMTTQDPFATGLAGALLKRRFGMPLQVQNHSDFFDNRAWLSDRPLRHRLFNWLGKRIIRRADFLRTVNEVEKAKYVAMGINPARVSVIPVPVGRPAPVKRVPLLIDAFVRVHPGHPEAHLVLVGDFTARQDVMAQVAGLGLSDAVRFAGTVPHETLPSYYRLCDIYAHSSAYEGFGLVLVEAAACGRPVVSTRTAGAQTIVMDGKTGLLCEVDDSVDLATRMAALLDNPERARAMGMAARAYVLDRFGRERTMQAIIRSWQQAASRR
jgi:glycosyltransferase involved in cell wall biosynthesis